MYRDGISIILSVTAVPFEWISLICGFISVHFDGEGVLCEAKALNRDSKRLLGKVEWLLCVEVDISPSIVSMCRWKATGVVFLGRNKYRFKR